MSDIKNVEQTTSGMTRKNLPITPGTKYIGMNATMFVIMLKVTGRAICRAL